VISVELKILGKKGEPLLSRTRVEGEAVFEKATPSVKEVKSSLAKVLGKDEKLLDVKGIYNLYGVKKVKILCYAYDDESTIKRIKVEGRKATEKAEKAAKAAQEQKDATQEAKKETTEEKKEEKSKEQEAKKGASSEGKKESAEKKEASEKSK
jgi:ribosomal protein S24E